MNDCKRRIIKIDERFLYSNHVDIATLKTKNEYSISVSNTLYIFNLDVSLLSAKKVCLEELHNTFDQYDLYLSNEQERRVLEASSRDEVYVVEKLASNIQKFALASISNDNEMKDINEGDIDIEKITKLFNSNSEDYRL